MTSYLHLTSWDPKHLQDGQLVATPTNESSYWRSKRELQQLEATTRAFRENIEELVRMGVRMPPAEVVAKEKLLREFQKELIFEKVRAEKYGSLPSRQRCIFLIPEGADPVPYLKPFGMTADFFAANGAPPRTLIRATPRPGAQLHRAPFSLLDITAGTPAMQADAANKYWGAEPSASPYQDEVLMEGEFTIEVVGPFR